MSNRTVNIIGAGSLGSFTALHLARLAPLFDLALTVWDEDKVAPHNARNQLYTNPSDVGRFKVEALQRIVRHLENFKIDSKKEWVTASTPLRGTVITLVDSMKARSEIFRASKLRFSVPFYIDARSGGTGAVVYALDPRDPDCLDCYERTLHADAEGVPAPCADQLTVPVLWLVAGAIGRILTRFYGSKMPRPEFITVAIDIEDLPGIDANVYNSYSPSI